MFFLGIDCKMSHICDVQFSQKIRSSPNVLFLVITMYIQYLCFPYYFNYQLQTPSYLIKVR